MPDAILPAIPSADAIVAGASRSAASDSAGRRERAKHRRRMKAGAMGGLGCDQTEAAQQLSTRDETKEAPVTAELLPFARRQYRWDNDGPGVNGPTLERIVVILAMRSGTVDERRAKRVEPAGVSQCRAGSPIGSRHG